MRNPMFGWLQDTTADSCWNTPFLRVGRRSWSETSRTGSFSTMRARSSALASPGLVARSNGGLGGLEITDEIRVTMLDLRAFCAWPGLHLYSNVKTICVYSSTVIAPGQRSRSPPGSRCRAPGSDLRPVDLGGPVVLVWDAVLRGAVHPERGHNVVYTSSRTS